MMDVNSGQGNADSSNVNNLSLQELINLQRSRQLAALNCQNGLNVGSMEGKDQIMKESEQTPNSELLSNNMPNGSTRCQSPLSGLPAAKGMDSMDTDVPNTDHPANRVSVSLKASDDFLQASGSKRKIMDDGHTSMNSSDGNTARRVSHEVAIHDSMSDTLDSSHRSCTSNALDFSFKSGTSSALDSSLRSSTSNTLDSSLRSGTFNSNMNMMGNSSMNFNNLHNSRSSFMTNQSSFNDSLSTLDSCMNGGAGQASSNSVSLLQRLYSGGMDNVNNNFGNNMNVNNSSFANQFIEQNSNSFSSFNNSSSELSGGVLAQMPYADAPLLIPPKRSKNKQKQSFAQKLMHILTLKECQNIIRWMPAGNAFCIVDQKELVEKILPVHFKEAKYASFTRKLNRWGFRHFNLPSDDPNGKDMSIYSHEKFLRDAPDLCKEMDGGHRRRGSSRDEQGLNQQYSNSLRPFLPQDQFQSFQFQQLQNVSQNPLFQGMQQQQQSNMYEMFSSSLSGEGCAMGGPASNQGMASATGNQDVDNSFRVSNPNLDSGIGSQTHKASLGFMPYMPVTTRRDSGPGSDMGNEMPPRRDSGSGLGNVPVNTVSPAGNSKTIFSMANASSSMAINSDNFSLQEQFRKASFTRNPELDANNNNNMTETGKRDFKSSGGLSFSGDQDQKVKLQALTEMISNERRKQAMLSNLDPDPVKNVPKQPFL